MLKEHVQVRKPLSQHNSTYATCYIPAHSDQRLCTDARRFRGPIGADSAAPVQQTMPSKIGPSRFAGGVQRLPVNDWALKRAWESSQRSTKEDWAEWMRHFSVELLKESPSPALRATYSLAQVCTFVPGILYLSVVHVRLTMTSISLDAAANWVASSVIMRYQGPQLRCLSCADS